MADSSRVRGSIAGDCEGEGGERGKRGKRGHRGPQGPGFDTDAPFWPPFPALAQTGDFVTTTIYANATGSDMQGDGSIGNPFATFARAVLNIPHFINPGHRVIVDITGLGTEVLPQDWEMPPIVNVQELFFVTDQSFFFATALTIRAYPKLALAPADSQVSSADSPVVSDVGPGLTKVTIAAGRAAWAGGALKGKQVVKSSGDFATACCIFDSSPTELFLCNTSGAINGGVGPLVLAPGETLDIVDQSAALMAPPSGRGDAMVFSILGNMNFQGIAFSCTVPNAGNGSFALEGGNAPFFELCNINECDFLNAGALQVGLFSTTLSGYVNAFRAQLTPRRSYWDAVGASLGIGTIGFIEGETSSWRTTVFDNCQPVATAPGFTGVIPTTSMAFLNCWFRASQGDAISLNSPTRLTVTDCQIDDSLGNAISVDGPLKAVLSNVTGTGNAGYGVVANDGAHVQVDAGVTVGTADGQAYINGNNAPVAGWPGVSFNDTDLTTFSRVFEP